MVFTLIDCLALVGLLLDGSWADSLDMAYIRAVLVPLAHISIVATVGLNDELAGSFCPRVVADPCKF
jgi:hypothetical protein